MKAKCATKYCRNAPRGTYCNTCYKRRWRAANKMRDCYHNLKSNAKRRGVPFSLTFPQFESFAVEVNLLKGIGKTATSYHIDRFGYTPVLVWCIGVVVVSTD